LLGGNRDEIRKISNNYQLPEDACASYSFLFKTLDEFENDLHIHVHLENNILFPKALEMEKK
jgi:regulator of cell morphogenesis and NO signaling